MRLLTIVTLLCLVPVANAGNRMATVQGYCYLLGEDNHSNSKIVFTEESPSAVTDSCLTDSIGFFSIGLSGGLYSVRYSHPGYESYPLEEP